MGVLTSLKKGNEIHRFSFNTGTHFDLATGNFLPGEKGHMILNGGLAPINSIIGRAQMFKSSVANGYTVKATEYYKPAEALVYDSEMSIAGIKRLINLGGQENNPELESRISLKDPCDMSMEGLFNTVRDIAAEKQAHKSDYIKETPFIDPTTGKRMKAYLPTFIGIDSWSRLTSAKVTETRDKHDLGDAKTNMLAMMDGKMKSEFFCQMPQICASAGIIFVLTAHIGNNTTLDPYAPVNKDVPMMNASDKLKSVGSQFTFLSTNMLQTKKVGVLQDDKKKCLYPTDYSSDVELQEIMSIVCRCKNNVSGAIVNHISSQYFGIQESLEYYHIIKDSKSELLSGTIKQNLGIIDREFTRHNIRKLIADDYEFRRALEILGQFVYIRNRWNLPQVKKLGYVEFVKKFMASKELATEMLNSSGIWSFCDIKRERPYLSILDIIEMIDKKA